MIRSIIAASIFIFSASVLFLLIYLVLYPFYAKRKNITRQTSFSDYEVKNYIPLDNYGRESNGKIAYIDDSVEVVNLTTRYEYCGPKNCEMFNLYCDTQTNNQMECLGYGSCVSACDRGAIYIKDSRAFVNDLCNGCGKCISSCPKKLISLLDKSEVKLQKDSDSKSKKHFNFNQNYNKIVRDI